MVYRMVYHTISMALSQKELIPQVELPGGGQESANAQARGLKPVVIKENRPEPFEKRRLQTESLIKSAATSELSGEPETSAYTERVSKTAFPAIADMPAVYGRQPASAGMADAAEQPETLRMPETPKAPEAPGPLEFPEQYRPVPAEGKTQNPAGAKEILPEQEPPKQLDLFEEKLLTKQARNEHVLIGQLFDTYWLVQFHDNLYIIDQHAAHEKVLYEKTVKSLKDRDYSSQMVEPPIILTLNPNEELLLNKYMEYFTRIGFEIEPFGGREFAVRAVPANLFSIAKKELLLEMIDGLSDEIAAHNPDSIYEKIASMSCKAAVKGGNHLSAMEANELIDQLLKLDNPYACPHGRPTIISMSRYELEKKFKRIV